MDELEGECDSDTDAEWEEVGGPTGVEGDAVSGGLEIVVPTDRGHKGKGKRKRPGMVDLLEKALASYQRELRQELHRVHLLCLLARGMLLSQQCDDPTLQSVLLSMLAPSNKQLGVPEEAAKFSKVTLLKLLRWFCHESSRLQAAVLSHVGGALECENGVWSGAADSQMLVSLLRSLGLRSRLVMVLHPLPLKTPASGKAEGKGESKKGKGRGKKVELKGSGSGSSEEDEDGGKQGSLGEKLLQYNLQKGLSCGETPSSAEAGSGDLDVTKEPGGCSGVTREGGGGSDLVESRSRSLRGKVARKKGDSSDGRKSVRGKGKKRSTTARTEDKEVSREQASPYFVKKECEGARVEGPKRAERKGSGNTRVGSRGQPKKAKASDCTAGTSMPKVTCPKGRRMRKSPSPEFIVEEEEDGDDDYDFVSQRKRRRKSVRSATSSKKPKKALTENKERTPTKPKASSSGSRSSLPSPLLSRSTIPPSSLPSTSSSPTPSALSSRLPSTPSSSSSPAPSSLHSRLPSTPSSHTPSISSSLSSRLLAGTAESAAFPPAKVEFQHAEETGHWAEVLSPDQQRWWCVHPPSLSIDQPKLCEKHCTIPLRYVVAFESENTARDVTPRYASDWCTDVRRQRVNQTWWEESLRPYQPDDLMETMRENEAILSKLKSQPLPLTISEYKNHPLYALRRHLLKFEAIYPEDSEVLGHCKGEPVYARENVHMLHTRETWLKEGRLVRVDEKAYRMVKARPKKGQSAVESRDNTVEVFGRWQTEEYIPPLVVEGKVPRNEYGNVEMFKPSMLPIGGAHVQIQGIQKVARKLNIDFAPAMVGWDFHGGHTHPMFDGIVVAKEMEEVLLEAWETEEQLQLEKEVKKREKRVMDRWRRLVRGVVIRDRVMDKFKNINS